MELLFPDTTDLKNIGLDIPALFDNNPEKIGLKIEDKEIFSLTKLPDLAAHMNINIAILTVPTESAQNVTDFLVKSGIKAIWNFSPVNLVVPQDIVVSNQDLGASFITFSLMLQNKIIA